MSRVQKWGNSLAIRIPKEYADKLHWDQNTDVALSIVDGKLVTEAVNEQAYDLQQLLAEIKPDNVHSEITTGRPVGNEAW
ncbi:MAG: AbrB/MazE/SpoVT family DNA-binding domain-containing protein [Chloroflexia bacterium]